jgi:hypothetical protein
MIVVPGGLRDANWLLRHPCIFHKQDGLYVPRWYSLRSNAICIMHKIKYAVPDSIIVINAFIKETPDFIIAIVVKLILLNFYIIDRDIVWYTSNSDIGPLHLDIICYNPIRKQVCIICLYYTVQDHAQTKKHAREIVRLLCNISPKPINIIAFVLPIHTYIRTQKIIFRSAL